MESTEYATQLATFSGVEQQVRTNELLETLSNGYATWARAVERLDRHAGHGRDAGRVFNGAPVTVQTTPRPARIASNWS
jgi:flagellar basal-body rod modification protein FlgD